MLCTGNARLKYAAWRKSDHVDKGQKEAELNFAMYRKRKTKIRCMPERQSEHVGK